MERLFSSEPSENQSQPPEPGFSNTPDSILSAWTALEVLSPSSFRRETDLAGGEQRAVMPLNREKLPWEAGIGGRKHYRLYYQVVLGSIKLGEAVTHLSRKYGVE